MLCTAVRGQGATAFCGGSLGQGFGSSRLRIPPVSPGEGWPKLGRRDASVSIDARLVLLCSAATVCLRRELASVSSSAQCRLQLAITAFARAAWEAAVPLLAFKLAPPHTAQLHAAGASDNVARRAPPTARRALRDPRRTHEMRRGHAPKTHHVEGVVRQARAAEGPPHRHHGRPVCRKDHGHGQTISTLAKHGF